MPWSQTSPLSAVHFFVTFVAGAAVGAGAVPVGLQEYTSGTAFRRIAADLTGVAKARLTIGGGVVGVGSDARVQYSADGGTSWDYLDAVGGPTVSLGNIVTSSQTGPWASVVAAARKEVILRLVTINGNGVSSPSFVNVQLELSS